MAKGYWVSAYRTVFNPEMLAGYNRPANPAVRAGGGRVLSRSARLVAHEAGNEQRVVLIEFESFEQAVAAYESRPYAEALAVLSDSVERGFRIVEGFD